ncbi:lipoyl(octanoyl) transferase LIP2 [Sporobolomyces koalae]|uniref:lipoyl(octanoyl) transferase LIP2 n=1 Tax=Sporobolomyces koalae TaxID=500713 RepID=UPI00316EF2FC
MLPSLARRGPLRPIRWTYLPEPIAYTRGLILQERLVQLRLDAKQALESNSTTTPSSVSNLGQSELDDIANTDVLLLLQHRPVYTAGKRETDPVRAANERERLGQLGADYVQTNRGGQTTYHGPGQLVGYPLVDLAASKLSTRCYVDRLETFLKDLVESYGIKTHPLEHTGVFVSETSKIASIGVQIRRRITMHGFSINLEQETRRWFDQIVACGLDHVTSTSVEAELFARQKHEGLETPRTFKVENQIERAVELFSKRYDRQLVKFERDDEFETTRNLIRAGVQGELEPVVKKAPIMGRM